MFAYILLYSFCYFNPLEFRGNYSATSNNMQFVHWPLMVSTTRRGLGRTTACPEPTSLYQM